MERDEVDPFKLLREIDDPNERQRTAREWGLLGLNEHGQAAYTPIFGQGYDCDLNRAILGHDLESFLQGDPVMIAEEQRAEQRRQRTRLYLTKDQVAHLYDAASFLVQEHAVFLNSQITICYRQLGMGDHRESAKCFSDLLRELRMRLKDWGYDFHWLYVHENSAEHGFHTHLVSALPNGLRADIKTWILQNFFAKRCYGPLPADAVDVQISGRRDRAQLHAHRLRYICKGLDPEITERDENGGRGALIELIGIPERFRRPAGLIECAQRCGVSQSLGSAVVKARAVGMAPLSAFRDKAWSWLYKGWEIEEHVDRSNQRQIRQLMRDLVRCEDMGPVPPGSDIESFDNPIRFRRSWAGWWVGKPRYRYRDQR